MKHLLLFAFILISCGFYAQADTIKKPRKPLEFRQKRFELGGALNVFSLAEVSYFVGPMVSFKANAKNGRIAGILNLSYNFGNSFNIVNVNYYQYPNLDQSVFYSTARYNALKLSLAMQVPFINRSNKKGFGLSGILGASYLNGLGSGKYISFADKPNSPAVPGYVRPSSKFTLNDRNNLVGFSIDLGLNLSYTIKRMQLFADVLYNTVGISSLDSTSDSFGQFIGRSPRYPLTYSLGARYCFY